MGYDVHPVIALVVEDGCYFLVLTESVGHGGASFLKMGIKKATDTKVPTAL